MKKHFNRCEFILCRKPVWTDEKVPKGHVACCDKKCAEKYHQQQIHFYKMLQEWKPRLGKRDVN